MPTVVKQPQLDTPVFNSSVARQAIINGNFDVWQRGTSFTPLANTQTWTADRWWVRRDSANYTVSQAAGVSLGSSFGIKLQRNNANAATDAISLHQPIESSTVAKLAGKNITISFLAKCGANYSASGSTLILNISTGTGINEASIGAHTGAWTGFATSGNLNQTLTTSFQRFSRTFAVASNVRELDPILVTIPVGTAGADDSFTIEQFQISVGDVVLPFPFKSYAEELRGCQRYYVASSPDNSTIDCFFSHAGVSDCAGTVNFPVQMRISPEIHIYNTTTPDTCFGFGIGAVSATVSVGYQGNNGFASIHKTNAFTSETLGALFHYKASAEL